MQTYDKATIKIEEGNYYRVDLYRNDEDKEPTCHHVYRYPEGFKEAKIYAESNAIRVIPIEIYYSTGLYDMVQKDSSPFRPSHYHDAPFDVIKMQGYIVNNFRKYLGNKIYAYEAPEADVNLLEAQCWAVGAAVKHLARLGKKDDVMQELEKAENYIHYARTGSFLE